MYFRHAFGMQTILGGHVGMHSRVHIVRLSCVRYYSSVSRPDVLLNNGNVFRGLSQSSLSVHSKFRQTVSDRGLSQSSLSVHSTDSVRQEAG